MIGAEAATFAALGDTHRLAIVARLAADGALPTARLHAGDTLSRQGLTKHLRVLEKAGLVTSERRGRERHWHLRPERLRAVQDHLADVSARWDARLARLQALIEREPD